jgi:hypothetical protein
MDGHYQRRDEDKDTSVSGSFRESAASYANDVKESKDPLMKLVSDLAGGAGDFGGRVRRGFAGFTSNAPKDAPDGPQDAHPDDEAPEEGSPGEKGDA